MSNEWISVDEQLPDGNKNVGQKCLVYGRSETSSFFEYEVATHWGEGRFKRGPMDKNYEVSHWRALPPAPHKEQE